MDIVMPDHYRSSENTNFKQTILYIIGIVLLLTSQNQATRQARHIHRILKVHNTYRRMFANGAYSVYVADMKKLEWSFQLQKDAKSKLNCGLIYNNSTHEERVNVGVSDTRNYSDIISEWFSEVQHYLADYKTCRHTADCMHFLNIINAYHTHIGCDVTKCIHNGTKTFVMMCLYAGGKSLLPPYKRGKPCTKCSSDAAFCDHGLCVACKGTSKNCDCRKTCFKKGIGAGHLNTTTCTCDCSYGNGPNCDEHCRNPEQYLDYDICESVTKEECLSEDPDVRSMLHEFCPEQCVCSRSILTDTR